MLQLETTDGGASWNETAKLVASDAAAVNRFFLTKFTTFLTENYKNNSKTSDNTPKIDDKYDKISHLKFTHF